MLTIIRSELRGSWPAWLGVALGFVMTSFALALSAMVFQSAFLAREVIVPAMEADAYLANGGTNFVLSLIVGLSVVASSTELVVQSRRGAVARMSLVGSTPSGVVTTVVSQLGVVALLSAVIGNLLAVAAVRPALDYLQYGRRERRYPHPSGDRSARADRGGGDLGCGRHRRRSAAGLAGQPDSPG